jgi:hypothetical protein
VLSIWLVDSFLNEGDQGVKVRFGVVDFNLLGVIEGVALMNQQNHKEVEMLVNYDSLVDEISRVLSNCRLAAHQARVKALSPLLQGMLWLCEASLSGMGRGAALLDEEKTFRGQLKRAFRFLNHPHLDPWEVGKALFDRLTEGLEEVLIAVDWTHVGDFMILEATLVEGRGIPFFSLWFLEVRLRDVKGPWS